jgi:uncharacterized repeat protein (TIGR03843 family)
MSTDELTQPAGPDVDALDLLTHGDVSIVGRMPYSSNATFLVDVRRGDEWARAIYKPGRGERPLWDFPEGLFRREVAAYRLSEEMGLHLIPPTVLRTDAPFDDGSLQWFVEADFQQHYFSLYESRLDLHDRFRAFAVFDFVANNTDRNSGHCLIDANDAVWGIDQGLCFSEEFKLRTVIWEFGGEKIPDDLMAAMAGLVADIPESVAALLTTDEMTAVQERAAQLTASGVFPIDGTGRRYPWPLI